MISSGIAGFNPDAAMGIEQILNGGEGGRLKDRLSNPIVVKLTVSCPCFLASSPMTSFWSSGICVWNVPVAKTSVG
jgi:hypothetical protein